MYPIINLAGREIGSYGLMAALGGVLAGFVLCIVAHRRKHGDDDTNILLMLFIAVGVLIGSHFVYGLVMLPYVIRAFMNGYQITSFASVVEVVVMLFGGGVFYGGLGGGAVAALIYTHKKGLDKQAYADMLAPVIPLFHTFGRIGCFLGGCCYGMEWEHGFVYTQNPIEQANGVPRFPVQLVEAGFNLLLCLVLFFLLYKGLLKGKLILVYLFSYAPARFILEFFRGDTYRGFVGVLSTSQTISVLIVFACIGWLLVKHFRKPKEDIMQA